MGETPKQKQTDFSLLYEEAHASVPLLDETGTRITQAMKNFDPALSGVTFQQGPVKAFDRAAAKLIDEKTGKLDPAKASGVIDLVRGRIVVDTPEQVQTVRRFLAENAEALGIKNIKDRFAKPSGTHYRDINLSVELENGHIAEIQINQKDMLAASEFTHDAYEEIDKINRNAAQQNRDLNPQEQARRAELLDFVRDVHDRGASRVQGLDSLLSQDGQNVLKRDHAQRLAEDPNFKPGQTIRTKGADGQTTKYGRIVENNPDFIDQAVARGKDAYKDMAKGIVVDKLEIPEAELAKLRQPRLNWDAQNRQLVAKTPDVVRDLHLSPERYSRAGVAITVAGTPLAGNLTRTFGDAGSNTGTSTGNADPKVVSSGSAGDKPVTAKVVGTGTTDTPPKATDSGSQGGTIENRTSVDADTPAKTTTGASGDGPSTAIVRTGSGATSSDEGGGTKSRWQQAVSDAGGAGGMTRQIVGKAGYGLSAFSLSQQLLGENSTFKRDIQNKDVATRAVVSLSLDAAVFTADTVEFGADIAKYSKSLKHLDKLDDLARISSTSSKIAKFSKVAGPVGTAVTIVTSGLQYSIAESLEDGKRAASAIGGGAGGLGGAAAGAGIGVWFGGPVGAGVGALVGGLLGGWGGSEVAEHYWADDFQEAFDEKAITRQRENLSKLEGLGKDLESFITLEQRMIDARKRLVDLYDSTDTKGKDHKAILAMDGRKMAQIDLASSAYQAARVELARNVEGSMLSSADKQTLESVMDFIQERKAFLVAKQQHLTETGDTAALARLANDRKGLAEAEAMIQRWQGLNEAIGDNYGRTRAEALRKADEDIAPLVKAVSDRKAHIADYQDRIYKYQAATEQKTFERTLTQRLDKVNGLYNSGQTDDRLMQRSAAILHLVESGQMDAATLREAETEVRALQAQHKKELTEMTQLQTKFQVMTRVERAHCSDPYKKTYAGHNLVNLKAINLRMTEITDSYKVSQDIASHTLKAAQSAAALRTLTASGTALTGEAAVTASGHIVNIAGHTADTLTLLGQDLKSTAQLMHGEWGKVASRPVIDIARFLELRDQSKRILEGIHSKVAEIETYQATLRDTLENGYKQGEQRVPLSDEYARQRMQQVIDRLETLKHEYSEQGEKIAADVGRAEQDIDRRVLQRGDATITLDRKGYVATYTVGEKTITFGARNRPLLVDENANIYNSAKSLHDTADVDFYLYRGGVVTKMGETFQGDRSKDEKQLKTIEDRDERQQVRETEQELTRQLRGKTIKNAISEMPKPVPEQTPPPQGDSGTQGASLESEFDEDPELIAAEMECLRANDPAFIEAAIALEKMQTGEVLDEMEQEFLRRVLDGEGSDPAVREALQEQYPDAIATFRAAGDENTESSGDKAPQPYIADQAIRASRLAIFA